MKKLWSWIAAFAAIMMLFAGCSSGGGGGGGPATAVTGITLKVLNTDDVELVGLGGGLPSALPPGAAVKLAVEVKGTGKFVSTYTIDVDGDGFAADTTYGETGYLCDPNIAADDPKSITVTVVADGNTTKVVVWDFAIVGQAITPGEAVDPDDPYLSAEGVVAVAVKAQGKILAGAKAPITAEVKGIGTYSTAYDLAIVPAVTGVSLSAAAPWTVTVANTVADNTTFNVVATAVEGLLGTDAEVKKTVATLVVTPKLKVYNTKGWQTTLDPLTTPDGNLPTASNKRYTIVSNEQGAEIDNALPATTGSTGMRFRDVTIVYLDYPFEVSPEFAVGREFGIEARMRIKEHRDSAPLFGQGTGESWGSGRQGVIIGAIAGDPSDINLAFNTAGQNNYKAEDYPGFLGTRILASGQRRAYGLRSYASNGGTEVAPSVGSDNLSGTMGGSTTGFNQHDYTDGGLLLTTTKVDGYRDQEYVYKVLRTGFNAYTMTAKNANNQGADISNITYQRGNNQLINKLAVPSTIDPNPAKPAYLCFIVYGVTVELSDIKIYENGEVVWEDPNVKDAPLLPEKAKKVVLASGTPSPIGAPKVANYVGDGTLVAPAAGSFPAAGVLMSATVYPESLTDKSVSWSLAGGGAGSVSVNASTGTVTQNTGVYGTSAANRDTITATPTVGWADDYLAGEYTVLLVDPAATTVLPSAVAIDTTIPATMNPYDELVLTSSITPPNALVDTVVWSVDKDQAAGIFPDGTLRVFGGAVDETVTVTATVEGTSVKATKTFTAIAPTTLYKKWTFNGHDLPVGPGTATGQGWRDVGGTSPNTVPLTVAKPYGLPGLTLLAPPTNGTAGGNRWWTGDTDRTAILTGNRGYIQFNTGAISDDMPLFRIEDQGVPVKVTVVMTGTGNAMTNNRFFYIKIGESILYSDQATDEQYPGDNTPPVYDGSSPKNLIGFGDDNFTKANASFSFNGQGAIEFGGKAGNPGGCNLWEIRVEGEGALPPPWQPTTNTVWTFGLDSGLGDAVGWTPYWTQTQVDNASIPEATGPIEQTSTGDATITKSGMSLVVKASLRAMRWVALQPSGGSSWTGAVQTTGDMAPVIQLPNVQGPFRVTVDYTGSGSGQTGRRAVITVNGVDTTGPDIDATAERSATYTYTGTSAQDINITRSGGDLRFFRVTVGK